MVVHNVILVFPGFHLHREHCTLLFHIFAVLIGPYIAIFFQISYKALALKKVHGPWTISRDNSAEPRVFGKRLNIKRTFVGG